jgi:uncharacterized protein
MSFKPLLISLAVVFAFFSIQLAMAQDGCTRPRLISVTGTAEMNVPPDEVILTVAVQSRDHDLTIAKSQHDSRAKKVLAAARDAGIEPKYIQTSSLHMNPAYSDERVPRFLAYEVAQTIQLTLKDVSKYDSLATRLIAGGVNSIQGVDFRVADSRKYKDDTRLMAIRAAKEKATAMAAELGQNIGKPWEIIEETESNLYQYYQNSRVVGGIVAPPTNEPTVAPGQIAIRSSVKVSFQLE